MITFFDGENTITYSEWDLLKEPKMTPTEIWKDIPEYEGYYQVSSFGRVKSIERMVNHRFKPMLIKEKIRKNLTDKDGYPTLRLHKNSIQKTYRVHQLVAMAFLNHVTCGLKLVVDHKDNNPSNNNLDNLQVVTNRRNCSKDKKGYTSKYLGVSRSLNSKKWLAQININGKQTYLGRFSSELEAHYSYQKRLAQINLKG